jgi:CspA family cold shock protein
MQSGKVKFFNEAKGFGFIKEDGSGTEVFVHVTGVKETIKEGDDVVYDTEEGRKGLTAVNVKLKA